MKKRLKIFYIIFFMILLITIPVAYFSYEITKPVGADSDIIFEIKEGDTLNTITSGLKKNDLIGSKLCFKILAYLSKNQNNMKYGEYKLNKNMNQIQIMNKFIDADVMTKFVTIPEGLTISQTADIIGRENIASSDDLLKLAENNNIEVIAGFKPKTLEGYLLPETYNFIKNSKPEKIIEEMLSMFRNKTEPLLNKKNGYSANGLSFNQVITLASLIEAEAQVAKERPVIASVYLNRLKIKMPLQCDATVQYARKKRKEILTYDDLKIDSPFNTYKIPGLPPSPICSPGIDSIKAAVNPAKTPYFYYVRNDIKNDGSHIFTRSLNEHNEAINNYQK